MRIVDAFRSAYPEITIITDVIVGFPGETDQDFMATMDLIESLQAGQGQCHQILQAAGHRGWPVFMICRTASRRIDRER